MFLCNRSAVPFFLCLLFYLDTSVHSEKARKADASKDRLSEDRNEGKQNGKYRAQSSHDSVLERLMEGSEKYLRTSSPIEYRGKNLPTGREKTPRPEMRRRFGTFASKIRPVRRKNKDREKELFERRRIRKKGKNLRNSSRSLNFRENRIKSVSNCSTSQTAGPKGCLNSGKRQKRQIWPPRMFNLTINETFIPCIIDFPLPILDWPVFEWPAFDWPAFEWPFQWPTFQWPSWILG